MKNLKTISMMRNIAIAVGALALTASVSSGAIAATTAGKFAVRGVGSDRCEAVSAAFKNKDGAAVGRYAAWTMGYASAFNRLVTNTFDAVPMKDARGLLAITLTVCNANPKGQFESATFQVLRALGPLRLTGESPLVTLTSDGKTHELHEETVRLVEIRLKALKFYSNAPTGKTSPQLTSAIKAFQQSKKLAASGLPDMATLIQLVQEK